MKRLLIFSGIPVFFFLSACQAVFSQEVLFLATDWEDPTVFEKGQNAPHAFHVPFASLEHALEEDLAKCENIQLLNGSWAFQWVETPEQVPEGFWQPGYDVSGWVKIPVPSNWQMEGYGHPKFRNVAMTFESDPPHVPDYFNPVGCYKRGFTVPANWADKVVFLRFEGVKSAAYIWVNGKRVGYNQGGFEPAEFDLTPFLKIGENDLSVQVHRYCDGSYLENQDMWRLSGIFRDVKLFAQPKTRIHDHYVLTDLDADYRDAELVVEIDLRQTGEASNRVLLELDLLDKANESILTERVQSDLQEMAAGAERKLRLSTPVANPEKWSAEIPHLYNLLIHLKDEAGNTLEAFTQKVGFREIEYRDQILTVNGVPVKLNGINSHMHHPKKGQAVPLDVLRQDLLIMKRFNINCVRTSHYPPTPEYLDMADELGMYIVDEVGDEAHGNIYLSEDPAWAEMYKDRSRKLVYRDRNHPSVLFWSAGNESGSGENIQAVIETGKSIDPSRPAWMYGGNRFYIAFEDLVGPRYWIPLFVRNLATGQVLPQEDQRASFMDEYIAATGNSLGGMDEYWELIRSFPRLTGGAIWDYISPGIKTPRWILPDLSPARNDGQIMGRPVFTEGKNGRGLQLSGHDDWVEFYRDPSLDIRGKEISIGFWVKPSRIPQANTFLAKGKYQYGIRMQDPDTLEFYIHSKGRNGGRRTRARISAKAPIGNDFYGNWHHMTGLYDGRSLKLYLDEQLVAETPFEGEMYSTPFPLCIGRESETQDQGEYEGRMSSLVIDEVRIFDRAVPLSDLSARTKDAVLALDFEDDIQEGDFYAVGLGGRTYGVVWPDRRIQPELYQMKRSGQPVQFELLDPKSGRVRISNHHHFKNLNALAGQWALQVGGELVQKGELSLDLPAGASDEVTIPFQLSGREEEPILSLSFSLKSDLSWADAGHEVAWEQFELPFQPEPWPEIDSGKQVRAEERDTEIRIRGANFVYTLDKTIGQLTSLRFAGTEYLEAGPEFQIWRAPLANDIDPWGAYRYYSELNTEGYGRSIDNQLRTMGLRDMRIEVDEVELLEDSGSRVVIRIKAWSLSSLPGSVHMEWGTPFSGFERQETWIIHGDGIIELQQKITPFGQMPEMLPRVGLQFRLPKAFREVEWYGRGPFETYPDRKTGARIGHYQSDVDAMYEPYLYPQDYGNRTDVRWLGVHNGSGKGLFIQADDLLNFSLQKFATDNLSRAVYTYQLQEAPQTVLNLDYEVSGVGGTANRQLQPYRVKAREWEHRLSIKPF